MYTQEKRSLTEYVSLAVLIVPTVIASIAINSSIYLFELEDKINSIRNENSDLSQLLN